MLYLLINIYLYKIAGLRMISSYSTDNNTQKRKLF